MLVWLAAMFKLPKGKTLESSVRDPIQASPLRVLLLADVRSPTTWGWVEAVRSAGVVILGADGRSWPHCPPAMSGGERRRRGVRQWLRSFAIATPRRLKIAQSCRRLVGPVLATTEGRRIRRVVDEVKPDIVHGMRIPFEAMTALVACPAGIPLAVSIWGNDLTLHASASRLIGRATRRVLARTDLLFADCQRDVDLAGRWGLRAAAATAVLPGGGGIDLLRIVEQDGIREPKLNDLAESDCRLVLNVRGSREYVRNDILLDALCLMAGDLDPRVRVVFVDAAQDVSLQRSIERHPLADRMIVVGKCSPGEVLSLFGRAEVSVSITEHDGTPNSLLEAMAAGAIPVCGDLPSIREWVQPGKNGFLATFDDPRAVADGLRLALGLSDAERRTIRMENSRVVATRAGRRSTGVQAADKYRRLADER